MMTRRMIVPLLIGLIGAAILISLGNWQVRRLAWKEGKLAEIEARIHDQPVSLPADITDQDLYLPVTAQGRFTGPSVRVLVSQKRVGAGHLMLSAFETDGRVVLVDRGFLPVQSKGAPPPAGEITVTGNIYWPDRIDRYTPDPDPSENLWFVRDVPAIAAHLGTDPVLVVARQLSQTDPSVTPLPVDTSGIPNDHLSYAVTWFGLATVWLGMTALLLWRIRRRTV